MKFSDFIPSIILLGFMLSMMYFPSEFNIWGTLVLFIIYGLKLGFRK